MQSIEDMIDIYGNASYLFNGEVMEAFLEQLQKIKNKEIRKTQKKDQLGKMLSEDNLSKKEINEKISLFLQDLDLFIMKQKYNFNELNLVIFQFLYRFNKKLDDYLVKKYFDFGENRKHFKNMKMNELIKASYVFSRYHIYDAKLKERAQFALFNIMLELFDRDFSTLETEEIDLIVANFSHLQIYPDLELFIRLEPYILKVILFEINFF